MGTYGRLDLTDSEWEQCIDQIRARAQQRHGGGRIHPVDPAAAARLRAAIHQQHARVSGSVAVELHLSVNVPIGIGEVIAGQ